MPSCTGSSGCRRPAPATSSRRCPRATCWVTARCTWPRSTRCARRSAWTACCPTTARARRSRRWPASSPRSSRTRSTWRAPTPTTSPAARKTASRPDRPQGAGHEPAFSSPLMDQALELLDITVTFRAKDNPGQRYTAVGGTTLRIAAGEFVSVVGPTGCGKSTLLNIGAGLLQASSGQVRVFGEPLAGINRRAGYMFQTEALMPWRSAIENVMVGLQYRGVADAQARQQAQAWLERVGLGGFE